MEKLTNLNNDINLILAPMFKILNEKNITNGVKYIINNNNLYVLINKDSLSKTNNLILEKISYIYCETLFYSNNEVEPLKDKAEYWCPDLSDKAYYNQVKEKIESKKMYVLMLPLNDLLTILGTTIELAKCLQEQDPLDLKVNANLGIYDEDLMSRHDHYLKMGSPDLNWLLLTVCLNKDNPLRNNPYANISSIIDINTPVNSDNVVATIHVGYKYKRYLTFDMSKEELEKTIKEYFTKINNKEDVIAKENMIELKRNLKLLN